MHSGIAWGQTWLIGDNKYRIDVNRMASVFHLLVTYSQDSHDCTPNDRFGCQVRNFYHIREMGKLR
jgi:hypothetical protein